MQHIGRAVEIEILGEQWKFARLDLDTWDLFLDWAKTILPDPVKVGLENIDMVAVKDAAIVRELRRQDLEEETKAKAEGRAPIFVGDKFTPISNDFAKMALDKKASYLSLNSPEIMSLRTSAKGSAYLLHLVLKPAHPDITPARAYEVMLALGDKLKGVIDTISGVTVSPAKNESAPAA